MNTGESSTAALSGAIRTLAKMCQVSGSKFEVKTGNPLVFGLETWNLKPETEAPGLPRIGNSRWDGSPSVITLPDSLGLLKKAR